MTARNPFLTARWSHLGLFTYAVPDELLAPHLPPGCEFDRFEGSAVASLVAFDFLDTRVFGRRWPFYTNFPELNLRYYVKHGDKRGVCFVREYVPRRLIAWVARWIYNEPYYYARMKSRIEINAESVVAQHAIRLGGRWHEFHWTSEPEPFEPPPDSVEHHFKEHQWGFVCNRAGTTNLYEVRHPVWQVHPVRSHHLDIDWATLYGPKWAAMQDAEPIHVTHAVGSDIAVLPAGKA